MGRKATNKLQLHVLCSLVMLIFLLVYKGQHKLLFWPALLERECTFSEDRVLCKKLCVGGSSACSLT